ncbi:uncharacterized protein LOC126968103 [Leptidea sinapis]|uniref:uncharacterized protein LOC126968103 n=1 Tax=Leptidea sinapis TaxID=189913 RepID=UPI0021339FCA|nr:uncharacterized protein LOC126968103 [Leptidea sinapis]
MALSRGCNLECVDDYQAGDEVIEFVGPVKIILVDPPKDAYRRRVLGAAWITLAHMFMGASVMTMLYYSLSYRTASIPNALHVFMFTVAFQLFMPSAILCHNKLNGAATHMTIADRTFHHTFLQLCSLGCLVVGFIAVLLTDYFAITVHSVLGMIACVLAVINIIPGFIVNGMLKLWVDEDRMEYTVFQVTQVHKVIGVLCFVASSGCFITGLLTDTFVLWVPIRDMSTISIIFCCYYTFVVIYKPLRHLQIL